MTWLSLALMNAVSESLKDLFAKFAAQSLTSFQLAFITTLWAIPLFLCILAVQGVPSVTPGFLVVLVLTTLLQVGAVTLYMQALSLSPLSTTLPMISFTPLFLLFTTPLMLGQYPSPVGILGVLLIVMGAYLLNISDLVHGLSEPIRALFREPGARKMLGVAFIWSITANLDPIGIRHSSKSFWLVSLLASISISFALLCGVGNARAALRSWKGSVSGIFHGLALFLYIEAISRGPLPYVISVKRTSILFGILLGALLFGERRLRERLIGASVMIAGVVVTSLARA